jgi:hypothetical protein
MVLGVGGVPGRGAGGGAVAALVFVGILLVLQVGKFGGYDYVEVEGGHFGGNGVVGIWCGWYLAPGCG